MKDNKSYKKRFKVLITFIIMLLMSEHFSIMTCYSASKKNKTDKSNYEVIDEDANVENETSKHKSKGVYVGPHKLESEYEGKMNVLVPAGGGGLGEGGGAIKKSGKTAGKNTDIKDIGDNLNDLKSSQDENNRDDSINETYGRAEDEGEFYKETEGKNAGKKIFEFDRNGNVGIDNNHAALEKGRSLMRIAAGLAFSVGIVSFLLASRDSKKKKNNYF